MKKLETIKRGRFTLGTIYEFKDGRKCLVSRQRLSDIVRGGEKSISDAVRDAKASWFLDSDLLMQMKNRGIQFVAIISRETGDKWLTTTHRFMSGVNFTRGYSIYKRLPFNQFSFLPARLSIK